MYRAGIAVPRSFGTRFNSGFYGGARSFRIAPVRFYRPYYSFRPRLSLGFGLWVGYPFAYGYPYYDPYYYAPSSYYPYGAAYPAYPYGAAYPAYPYSAAYPAPDQYPVATPYSAQGYPAAPTTTLSANNGPSDQSNMGGLSFQITPDNAQIFVDGNNVGTTGQFTATSQPLGLQAGPHHVLIRASGYQTITFDVDIIAGQVIPYQGTMER